MDPVRLHRLTFGLAAALGVVATRSSVPAILQDVAMVLSVGLAAFANAEHLPFVGPPIAKRREYIRRKSQELAIAQGPTPSDVFVPEDAETDGDLEPSEDPTKPNVPPGGIGVSRK